MNARLKQLLPRNRFACNVSVLVGGTAAGQLIVVAASPLLTRMYSPEDFGLLAVYAGLLSIVSVVASLCYELAIPISENDQEAASVAVLSVLILVGMTLLCVAVLGVWGGTISRLLNSPSLGAYLWLVPIGVLLSGIYNVLNYWAIRTQSFSAIARTKLTQAISGAAVQLGGYVFGPIALMLGQVVGQAAGNTSLVALTVRPRWGCFHRVRARDLQQAAKRWRRFPLYSSWSALFNTASHQLPPLLFAALFNPAAAGVYMLAHRVLNMPMQLLGQAIASVFYSSATDARREGQLAPLVADVHAKLAHVAMPPALVLVLTGPELFSFAFGVDWRLAGEFAQWMAPWLYLAFVTSPLSQLLYVLEKQAHNLALQAVLLGARTGGIALGAALGDQMLAVALFAISSAACYIAFLFWIMRASGNALRSLFWPSFQSIGISAFLTAPIVFYSFVDQAPSAWLFGVALSLLLISARYIVLLRTVW